MLRIEETTSRSFEERMADAVSAIPLISEEWTNHNPSDPGITILENLIVFEALQGSRITNLDEVTERALLKMAGFEAARGKCARLLLASDKLTRRMHLKNNQRFMLGDMVFETRRAQDVGYCHLEGIFAHYEGAFHDYSHLTDREIKVPARIFGDEPKEGDSIYFICDALPEPGTETSFYIKVDSRFNRNPLKDRSENIFAALKWECYTDEGFKEIKVKDFTGALITSGEVKLRFPAGVNYATFTEAPKNGCCIRATLEKARYDVRPRISQIDAFLFEVWQKDTRAIAYTFQKNDRIHISSPLEGEGYVLCFGRENKGESYRRYELSTSLSERGRYCLYQRGENGSFTLSFDKAACGYEPMRTKDAVRVELYSEEVMRQYHVGKVLGYDDQEIELPFKHVIPDNFSLIAKRTDDEGEEFYDFVRPGKREDDSLSYHLKENEGVIVIEDAGDFIGAELFIGGLSVTEGPKGNVRAGNKFLAPGVDERPVFYNPGPGMGGVFREKLEDVRRRFREDVYTPYTCVTAADYEHAVAGTPGLCIKKVKAVMDEMENLVHIAVMPGTDEDFPKLSDEYKNAIKKLLANRRLITTRFTILPPVYVGVSARLTVYVKRHFSDSKERIERRLKQILNYRESEKNFGEPLTFEEVFSGIEELDCVEFIYELFMRPDNMKYAVMKESNIYPGENCLLYPGQIELETVTSSK